MLNWPTDHNALFKPLASYEDTTFGVAFDDRLFMLPCTMQHTHVEYVAAANAAVAAVRAYRNRVSKELPASIAEFRFQQETQRLDALEELNSKASILESEIAEYQERKGLLCFQSSPLVQLLQKVFAESFQIDLTIDDEKLIEDASWHEKSSDKTLAVFEIKGVRTSFSRENVNQVDSHRERLGLKPDTPGVLIMNSIMSAQSLVDKDQPPHHEIIKKAVGNNVLLIRTLDILRLIDLIERGVTTPAEFQRILLGESGWLRDTAGFVGNCSTQNVAMRYPMSSQ